MAANEALLEIAELVGAHDEDRALIADWIDRGRRGLKRAGTLNSDCASIVTCGPENRCGFAPWPDSPP